VIPLPSFDSAAQDCRPAKIAPAAIESASTASSERTGTETGAAGGTTSGVGAMIARRHALARSTTDLLAAKNPVTSLLSAE
jgi:hypothetical protein